jgi:hypothetical protein
MTTGTQPMTIEADRPVVFRTGTVLAMDRQRSVLPGAEWTLTQYVVWDCREHGKAATAVDLDTVPAGLLDRTARD